MQCAPKTTLLGGMWSAITFPERFPQWWQPGQRKQRGESKPSGLSIARSNELTIREARRLEARSHRKYVRGVIFKYGERLKNVGGLEAGAAAAGACSGGAA